MIDADSAVNGSTFQLQGYTGGGTDSAALVNYINTIDSNAINGAGFTIFTGSVVNGTPSVTPPNSVPVTPLMAAAGQGAGADAISAAQLSAIASSAIDQLLASGLTAAQQAALDDVTFSLVDLTDGMLGQAAGNLVMIDIDGAGWGWFVDTTPEDSDEFDADGVAIAGGGAEGQADLLTTVMHELGHVLGLRHSDEGVMDDTLELGTRGDLDAFFASLD